MIIFIPAVLFLVCYGAGAVFEAAAKRRTDAAGKIVSGMLVFTGAFQICAVPFMYAALPFKPLYLGTLAAAAAAALFGLFRLIRGIKPDRGPAEEEKEDDRPAGRKWLFLLIALCVLYQVFHVVYYQHTDIDDSFFIAQINTILRTGLVHSIDPSSGLPFLSFNPSYKLVGHEVLLTVITKIFGVNPAFLSHTVLPVFSLPAHYLIIYKLGDVLFKEKSVFFVILYAVFNIFSGYSGYSQGAFLLYRIWQGKAVLACIMMPALFWLFLEVCRREKPLFSDIVILFLTLMAGFCATTVGISLVPVTYFSLFCGYCVFTRFRFGNIFRVCLPVAGVLPYIALKFKILYLTGSRAVSMGLVASTAFTELQGKVEKISYAEELFERFLNHNRIVPVLYVLAILCIFILGEALSRWMIAFASISVLLTFANPLFLKPVAKYITTASVYWRLFWCLEIPIVICAAVVILAGRFKKLAAGYAVLAAGLLAIALSGSLIFTYNPAGFPDGFSHRSNRWKLDPVTVAVAQAVNADCNGRDAVLILPKEMSFGIREYCGNIMIPINRYMVKSYRTNGMTDQYQELKEEIITPLYEERTWDPERVGKALDDFDADYVVFYREAADVSGVPDGLTLIGEFPDIYLYRAQ